MILEILESIIGVEIKSGVHLGRGDARALQSLAARLGAESLGGLVVYRGDRLERMDAETDLWALPVHRLP